MQSNPHLSNSETKELPQDLSVPLFAVENYLKGKLIGHSTLIQRLLITIIANGHLLIEGAPGLAKTRAVNYFAKTLEADFARIQSTPDLLPADITGTNIFQQSRGEFEFIPGPIFNNIILVDEINRAPPKVQSALLEAMAEEQISTAGVTRHLEQPFMVVATQNSLENEGTYPLPEAQLDRFMFFLNLDLPDLETEREILDLVLHENRTGTHVQETSIAEQIPTLTKLQLKKLRQHSAGIHLSTAVKDYITRLVLATRDNTITAVDRHIQNPASPRGSIALATAAQALALLNGRDHVLPEDIQTLAADALGGRIGLSYSAQAEGMRGRDVINAILPAVQVV